MHRKLVKQGPATLTVSVPVDWVRENGLSAGDEVSVAIENNVVMIASKEEFSSARKITIDARDFSERLLGNVLRTLHRSGYDEVTLHTRKQQFSWVLRYMEISLLGYEVVEQRHETTVLRFVTRVVAEELGALTRRSFLVTLSLADGAVSGEDKQALFALEETNNRITNYCERVLIQNVSREEHAVFKYTVIWLLEKVADEYKYILSEPFDLSHASITAKLLRRYYELYYAYSFEGHDELLSSLDDANTLFKSSSSPFLGIVVLLQQSAGSLIGVNIGSQDMSDPSMPTA